MIAERRLSRMQVAMDLGISLDELYRRIRAGEIAQPERDGLLPVWRQSALEAWMANKRGETAKQIELF